MKDRTTLIDEQRRLIEELRRLEANAEAVKQAIYKIEGKIELLTEIEADERSVAPG